MAPLSQPRRHFHTYRPITHFDCFERIHHLRHLVALQRYRSVYVLTQYITSKLLSYAAQARSHLKADILRRRLLWHTHRRHIDILPTTWLNRSNCHLYLSPLC